MAFRKSPKIGLCSKPFPAIMETMSRRLLSIATLIATASPATAGTPEPPCDGCAVAWPDTDKPVPLLVVLHGDHGTATHWLSRWRDAAIERGFGVLSLQCPEELGCKDGVWYMWTGDPKWVHDQIDKVAASAPIDRSKIVLAGWSGGGAYIGMHVRSWQGFAGLVMHGGAMGPLDGRCAKPTPPVYFFVGDKNQYHSTAVLIRDFLIDCRARVKWDLLKGGDHGDENKALDPVKAGQILDWFKR